MPIFVIVMHALCNACWDLVLSRAAMLIKHVLCLVLSSSSYGYYTDERVFEITIHLRDRRLA